MKLIAMYGLKSPCDKGCPDRKPGCNCEKYKAFRAELDARKAAAHGAKNVDHVVSSYQADQSRKKKRRVLGKDKGNGWIK